MNQRALGRTGIKVSEISFGGVEIGIPYGIGVDSHDGMLGESEAIKLLHTALDNGINFFDTARMYGRSEGIIGKAFKDRRDEVVIGDVIQLSFNLMDQRQAELFPYAQQNNIGIMVRSVLLKGILSDRGRNLHPALKSVEEHRNAYDELLNKDVPILSALATKFALSFQEVSSVLIGIDRMQYLQNALTVADGKYLDQNAFAKARELCYPEPEFLDLRQWDKMGWLK